MLALLLCTPAHGTEVSAPPPLERAYLLLATLLLFVAALALVEALRTAPPATEAPAPTQPDPLPPAADDDVVEPGPAPAP